MAENNHTVYFDGVCNLCHGFVKFLIKCDSKARFRFAPLQSNAGRSMLDELGRNPEEFDSMLYKKEGRLLTKSKAVLAIVYDLGGFWKIAVIGKLFPVAFSDWVYDQVASNRYRLFGKKDSCMVPTPELEKRFLK